MSFAQYTNSLHGPRGLSNAEEQQIEAERQHEENVNALYAEAMLRGHGNHYAAMDWLVYDYRQHPSAYEGELIEQVGARIEKQMSQAEREAWVLGTTLEEWQMMTRTIMVKRGRMTYTEKVAA